MTRRATWRRSATTSPGTIRREVPIPYWIELRGRSAAFSNILGVAAIPRNCWTLGFGRTGRFSSSPTGFIYRVTEDNVYVLVIADGRRDMRALLQRLLQQQA